MEKVVVTAWSIRRGMPHIHAQSKVWFDQNFNTSRNNEDLEKNQTCKKCQKHRYCIE